MFGRLYQVSNKSPEAEKAFNAALAVDSDNEEALTGLAKLYTDLGDSRRAAEKLKEIADKSPNERTLAPWRSSMKTCSNTRKPRTSSRSSATLPRITRRSPRRSRGT